MAKFMCTHTIPAGKFSVDQLRQLAKAAQQDPVVKGYRSFANLAEGKAVCVMEASNKEALAAWFAPWTRFSSECCLFTSRAAVQDSLLG
jgi:hypothetical protein